MAERLQKILSSCGVASRREAEKLIAAGRVTVNGTTAITGQSADPETDLIAVDNVQISGGGEKIYIALNKPRGYVTTVRDDRGRPTVMELVAGCGVRVYPVGRLDMDSEGLLIFTNDGSFANAVAHPSGEKNKTYRVTVIGDINNAVGRLSEPMSIDGYVIRPAKVTVIRKLTNGGLLEITIHEGRNRQIRKMCTLCGLHIEKLVRISVGGIVLGELKSGKWRYLSPEEVSDALHY